MTSAFRDCFSSLPDPRWAQNRQHVLLEILVIAFCAVLCGANGWEAMERFGLAKKTFFQERLGLTLAYGIPSADTFRRVFSRLDPEAFGACFRSFVASWQEAMPHEILALDGKTLRHSFDTAAQQNPLHLVSAWAVQAGVVLGQVAVEEKSNEITAVPALLSLLDITGCVVTADALNCQKTIAAQIVEGKGDYVLALKGNHPHLSEDVQLCLARLEATAFPDRPLCRAEATDYGHGRFESRECACVFLEENDPNWADMQQQWVGLRALVKVHRRVQRAGKWHKEVAYFLSSLSAGAARLNTIIRSHWHIENRLHWVLDVVFEEDACRVRRDHGPQNLAVLRHMAINQLGREPSARSLKGKQQMAAWDENFLLRVLLS